jgi:hypothetical protein
MAASIPRDLIELFLRFIGYIGREGTLGERYARMADNIRESPLSEKILSWIENQKANGVSHREIYDKIASNGTINVLLEFSICYVLDVEQGTGWGHFWRNPYNFPNVGDVVRIPELNDYGEEVMVERVVKSAGFFTFDIHNAPRTSPG